MNEKVQREHSTKFRKERDIIITNLKEIKGIVCEYCDRLHVNKLNNIDVIDKLSKRYKLPKVTQEEIDYWCRSVTSQII